MSLKQRMELEILEGDTLLSKPKWFTKEVCPKDQVEEIETELEIDEAKAVK
ncbi:hypothetical protein [Halobacteriovorax sp. HLS]|uniref:hypothetical protein n=1 Tax=Halobacteriovorax sp. HLS TaxID=2234000 RepID=UPI0013E3A6AE|nr:hypothetical protein [Halobacteriovorax sp. HLS]